MSTATAPIISKKDQAAQLRDQEGALGKEVTQLKEKLERASGALAVLQSKRDDFTKDAVSGRTPKAGAVAALSVAIDEAEIPVEGLSAALGTKQAALDQVSGTLRELEHEISTEAQREARQARLDVLKKQASEAGERIAEKIRTLLEEDLPALDAARNALTVEFIGGRASALVTPEATAARKIIHHVEQIIFDGPELRHARVMARAGWQPCGEAGLSFTVQTLRPPRR
jgi:chromosome segregation ATPase